MIPNEKELLNNLGKIAYTLDKTYLSDLETEYGVQPFEENYNFDGKIEYVSNIRALRVKRWVYDKDERINDCFKNILSLFANSDNSLSLVLHRTPNHTELFFVVKNEGQGRNEDSINNIELLADSLRGNFPGTNIEIVQETNGGKDTEELFAFDEASSISLLCSVPSEKSEDYISQGIEKLLNGVVPQTDDESYSVVILAEALSQGTIREILSGYEEMATSIMPFSGYQFQSGTNKNEITGEMQSLSHTEGTSHSISKTHSINVGVNSSTTNATSVGIFGSMVGFGASLAKTVGASLGVSAGYGYSWGTTDTKSKSNTKTSGTNHSISLGESENTTYTYKSYMVGGLIDKIEATINRITESQSTGLWKCATYVLSSNSKTSKNVANFLRSITQGDESYIEPAVIQEWSFESRNGLTAFNEIQKYLKHFTHPVFGNVNDGMLVTATSNVSTSELSNAIAFPRYSVQGIPVIKCARFGREPHSLVDIKKDLSFGCTYHMHQVEKLNRIYLNKNELTKHTFITGSTGSGKSNTIYKMLSELNNQGIKFLVVEPAKGEYKNVIGHREDVSVYGTNPLKTPMLRINPFKFPTDIHVLEHLDRLVEIFNVCWPMYAAMPAILKDSIERAYITAGWDLQKSLNKYDDRLFPTFTDVLEQIRIVLNESDYSSDNKGDYIGALATRIKSLTNGINGMIFTNNDLSDEELFDNNVIVDISRIGSSETKSLIMGLLVIKLQEYRMTANKQNNDLSHITVLEEAHNILKRTSTEQTADGVNLLGKAVEMLANAIAEMRTYGEGFVIADQSPGLLDMSVIRNTNTKIILRLPDFSDRELVGKASGLNDDQIIELSKLQQGVAAISQSDWLEPVLCKIDKFDYKEKPYVNPEIYSLDDNTIRQSLLEIIIEKEIYRRGDRTDLKKLADVVIHSTLKSSVKCAFLEYLNSDVENSIEKLRSFVYEFFNAKNAIDMSKGYDEIEAWAHSVAVRMNPSLSGYSKRQIDLVLALIVQEQALRDVTYNELLCRFAETYKANGGVF
ncbi:DUF87 domain-containing protein [Neobacillus niacini]|uniref:ATP-binding protein n=1 Tax=Neobacillus niacini TaxID=86668 RepID=UPI002FFF3C55